MKFFLFALAIASAAATPDADAESYHHGLHANNPAKNIFGQHIGYTGYSNGFAANPLRYNTYGSNFGAYPAAGLTGYTGYNAYPATHFIGKRDADADAAWPYVNVQNPTKNIFGQQVGYTGYSNGYAANPLRFNTYGNNFGYTAGLTGYTGYAPSVYGQQKHFIGKRDADAESDAAYLVNPYTTGVYNTNVYGSRFGNAFAPRPVTYTGAYAKPLYTGAYANAGLTGFGSPSVYGAHQVPRYIGKRDADADADSALVYKDAVTGFSTNVANLQKGINTQYTSQHGSVYNSATPQYYGAQYPAVSGYAAAYAPQQFGGYSAYSAGYPKVAGFGGMYGFQG